MRQWAGIGMARRKAITAVLAVAGVWIAAQVVVGELMIARIAELDLELGTAPGAVTTHDLRSSDICTLLTAPDNWRGRAERIAFPFAAAAAARLTATHAFASDNDCDPSVSHYRLTARKLP